MKRSPQQAMALVITLIMLSLITVVTVAFLAVARRDRASVTQAANITDSELMADAARERAMAELALHVLPRDTNGNLIPTNFGSLLVSLNQDIDTVRWTNWTDPRAPVFVKTPYATDFRFWLDLNRNTNFDETGFLDANGTTNGPAVGFFVGDPHWIGVLEDPGAPHGSKNRFLGRYAYLVQPAGKALDVNYIFNNAKGISSANLSGYLRDKGFGSWDINLAAFLADLNTNQWGDYQYTTNITMPSRWSSFIDANEVLQFRYENDFNKLARARQFFPAAYFPLPFAQLDFYADWPWPGSDNPKHFYSVHDFFQERWPYYGAFPKHLKYITANPNPNSIPYDRSTFYRMLEQLGTDSAPETDKININYSNAVISTDSTLPPQVIIYPNAPTSFTNWDPAGFLMTASQRLLTDELGPKFSWIANSYQTNPGVLIRDANGFTGDTNGRPYYSARVHQLMKVAANIHDATTTNDFPTVFRPQFRMNGTAVYITNYAQETTANFMWRPWHNLNDPNDRPINPNDNVYGIPLITGAKKGWPAFNKFSLQSVAQISRKLEVRKKDATDRLPSEVNQVYTIAVSNMLGFQIWNSSSNGFPQAFSLVANYAITNVLTNYNIFNTNMPPLPNPPSSAVAANSPPQQGQFIFSGWQSGLDSRYAFYVPLQTNVMTLTNSAFFEYPSPHFTNFVENVYEPVTTLRWQCTNFAGLALCLIYDGKIVDAVSLCLNNDFPISDAFASHPTGSSDALQEIWSLDPFPFGPTNQPINVGVNHQIRASKDANLTTLSEWRSYAEKWATNKTDAINNFYDFLGENNKYHPTNILSMQAPFTPRGTLVQVANWEVNDPLVHFTTNDLVLTFGYSRPDNVPSLTNLHQISTAYKPWKGNPQQAKGTDPTAVDESVKDPGVVSSDAWEFPNQKFANVGWLGRVHRGTPWQTIYLKSRIAEAGRWLQPDGPSYTMATHPTNDWRLVDYFTVAQHPNATRGQLSVNQTNLAAWSAVLSGATVTRLTNWPPTIEQIEPAAIPGSLLQEIVDGINRRRDRLPGGQFNSLSEILTVPELTSRSPFLRTASNDDLEGLKDRDWEPIPEQILSLLKAGDRERRFVIYAWGQSLKPAPNSILTSGGNFGMCVNYQITGEVATRAVVKFTKNAAVVERFNIMPPPQ